MRRTSLPIGLALLWLLLSQCHATRWNQLGNEELAPAPQEIQALFAAHPNNTLTYTAQSPGYGYAYDIGEKDTHYGIDSSAMRFTTVQMQLHDAMPEGKVVVDFTFVDGHGSTVEVKAVDLLRLIPKLDAPGDMVYPELLLEEYNRFGVSFRREHNEFSFKPANDLPKQLNDRTYRCQIVNNCLAATKWEFALTSEDYGDYSQRRKHTTNLNQNKILSHSWFYVDKALYSALMQMKNPDKTIHMDFNYDSLSNMSEQVHIDFSQLRNPIKKQAATALLEVGHQSGRKLEPVDIEEHYKWQFGIFLDRDTSLTYKTVLEQPIRTSQFKDEGYYKNDTPREFDWSWMQYMDSVQMDIIDVPGTDAYVQLSLTGKWSPYNITIGNVDLAQINEQKLWGLLFGINTYPKSRRYNPIQSTIFYDAELLPDNIKPYVLLTDKKTGKWVNNQYKGIEKVYLTYETLEQDELSIYLLSYERITPMWMARVKLSRELREKIRIRRQLYNY